VKIAQLTAEVPWGVLLIEDEGYLGDIPEWQSRDDMAASTESCVILRVLHAQEGSVDVYVWDADEVGVGQLAFNRVLSLSSGALSVHDPSSEVLLRVELPYPGLYECRVFVDTLSEASRIDVVLTPAKV
jgi:hypothetical protein